MTRVVAGSFARQSGPAARPAVSVDDVVASVLFVAVFLFFWISVDPFVDLTDPKTLLPSEGSNLLNQAVVVGLFGLCTAYAALSDMRRFGVLFTRGLALLLAWLLVCVATSLDPGLSARRYVLTAIVFSICAVMLVLPRDGERFAELLAASVLIVLVVCYLGVLLAPDYAVHQPTELLEPDHGGNWRGAFRHKNAAGAAMVMATIVGLYVARRRSAPLGWFVAAASLVFLFQTGSKTSLAIFVPALLLAWMVVRVRSTAVRLALVLGTLAAMNLFTVGSVMIPAIKAFNAGAMSDPTFTNRTDIWAYAVGRILERPWLGHGYEAFWGSQSVFFGESSSWANRASDSHSTYVGLALTIGLPGLALAIWYFVVETLRDLRAAERSGNDPAATLFFTRIWLFCLMVACLETVLFPNGGPMFFMLLIAKFGMRFHASSQAVLRADAASPVRAGA